MENEHKIDNFCDNSEQPENVFRKEYESQNLNKSVEFKNWKNSMIEKYGRNAKLFNCIYDNIYFYTSNKECKTYPLYQSICPLCNNPICYFCHRYGSDSYGNGTCCVRRKIYCFFFMDGLRLIAPLSEKDYPPNFDETLKFFLIPGINLLFFMATMHTSLFYKLSVKNYKNKKNDNGYLLNYELRYNKCYTTLQILVGIDIAFSIILTLSYVLLNLYFIVIILIISIPFKFYPMKYYMGIAYGTF